MSTVFDMCAAAFATRAAVSAAYSLSDSEPFMSLLAPKVIYNVVDMGLCVLALKYFQDRVSTDKEKNNNILFHIFYSRCIGCITGIAVSYLLFNNPISPIMAVALSVGAAVTSVSVFTLGDAPQSGQMPLEAKDCYWV